MWPHVSAILIRTNLPSWFDDAIAQRRDSLRTRGEKVKTGRPICGFTA